MVKPVFDSQNGVWKCPVCGFMAMSRKVVEQHIQREHSPSWKESSEEKVQVEGVRQESRESRKSGKSGKRGCVAKRKFSIGGTEVRLWDYEHLDIRDQRSWLLFQNRNYVVGLHKQRVRVKLVTGEEFEGLLKARDPYFVSLVTEDGPVYINKAHILYIKPLGGGGC